MANIEYFKKYKKIYMIGIGGISMSGIAEILKNWKFEVSGSDITDSEIIKNLRNTGINITIGHNVDAIKQTDLVVYTAAIKQDDPELLEAKKLNIPTIERKDLVGELTKAFSESICISGTHGKTTTSSMISVCFLNALLDPTIQVGAILKKINGNYKVGNSEYFILEACEYSESFLKFFPKAEVVLNIDNDHLDYFKTFENIKNAFIKYVKLLPDNGLLVINGDDNNCLDLVNYTKSTVLTYGINNMNSNFVAKNINFNENGFAEFDVYFNNDFYGHIELSIAGKHNVLNALACISICNYYGISFEVIKNSLLEFTGADRRLEFKGNFNNVAVYDDYGHHPTEIIATANAIKNKKFNESWVIFQPHTYSRTKNLLDDFVTALINFDHIIVTDIYAAREVNTFNISSKDLVDRINELYPNANALYIQSFDDIVKFIHSNVKNNDLVLTLGAGTVTEIGPMIVK